MRVFIASTDDSIIMDEFDREQSILEGDPSDGIMPIEALGRFMLVGIGVIIIGLVFVF